MSTQDRDEPGRSGQGASERDGRLLPWLVEPLRGALASRQAHALLVQGPGNVGQFDLAVALAEAWLCEQDSVPMVERPCGVCASCRLVAARSHPDMLVLVPEVMREQLGWNADAAEGEEAGEGGKRKPSKEIRVEAVRGAIAFALTTSARGRGKVVVVHPAERMNPIAANAFLKTLEEPAGASRFLLCTGAADDLLPTIRSRCQVIALPVPMQDVAERWLAGQGVEAPAVVLAASGGQPQQALAWLERAVDAAAWRSLPGRIARGESASLHGWPLGLVVETLQKICHDAAALTCGAAPRFFPRESLRSDGDIAALLAWSRALSRLAEEVDHPWAADLAVESLVEQGREALKTPRSPPREGRGMSLNSAR